jgi:hypothetical protein
MKRKHLSVTIAALLAAGGLWFAWSAWRSDDLAVQKSSISKKSSSRDRSSIAHKPSIDGKSRTNADFQTADGSLKPRRTLRPPVPNRRFTDFTPEERVEFARKGHGPGG